MFRDALYEPFRVKKQHSPHIKAERSRGGAKTEDSMECWGCFHLGAGAGAGIEPIQKRDHLLAIQSSKFGHHFGGEHVLVVGCDVMFNFIGTSPLELAERALAPRLVFFLQVSL